MRKNELFFMILVIACILSAVLYTVGGVLQDVDYHELSKLPLTEQQSEFGKMQTRKSIGEKIQLVSAILIFVDFLGIMITALTYGVQNAEKRAIKAEQAKARELN
jgi:hypothetical protein